MVTDGQVRLVPGSKVELKSSIGAGAPPAEKTCASSSSVVTTAASPADPAGRGAHELQEVPHLLEHAVGGGIDLAVDSLDLSPFEIKRRVVDGVVVRFLDASRDDRNAPALLEEGCQKVDAIFARGVDAIYFTPAGLGRMEHPVEAMFSQMSYFADIDVSYGAIALRILALWEPCWTINMALAGALREFLAPLAAG